MPRWLRRRRCGNEPSRDESADLPGRNIWMAHPAGTKAVGLLMTRFDISRTAFRFVLIIGIVNLWADMTYEGARGIIGPFMGSLGASAAVIGFVAGFGELIGYSLRSVSGYVADKTGRYWIVGELTW